MHQIYFERTKSTIERTVVHFKEQPTSFRDIGSRNIYQRLFRDVSQNLNVGDLVVIQVENVPRSHWPLIHIIKTYPGVGRVVENFEFVA